MTLAAAGMTPKDDIMLISDSLSAKSYETLDTHLAQSCCRGWRGGWSLKQDTVGFLFCLLLFHWRFPIYLSDQVIEDLRQQHKERR